MLLVVWHVWVVAFCLLFVVCCLLLVVVLVCSGCCALCVDCRMIWVLACMLNCVVVA